MKPYYDKDGIVIFHGDCREILPGLEYDAILTDPPYGINHPTNYGKRGRANIADCRDYPPVFGDDKPFDPSHLIGQPAILWGGNYYADKLPPKSGWLVWDKQRPDNIDQATCELAWSNCIKGVRRFSYLWHGCFRAGTETLFHPTQKPVALMEWCMSLRWWLDSWVICDPYMGSGPVLIAARNLGRRAIGIEIEERYCEIAANRLSQAHATSARAAGHDGRV